MRYLFATPMALFAGYFTWTVILVALHANDMIWILLPNFVLAGMFACLASFLLRNGISRTSVVGFTAFFMFVGAIVAVAHYVLADDDVLSPIVHSVEKVSADYRSDQCKSITKSSSEHQDLSVTLISAEDRLHKLRVSIYPITRIARTVDIESYAFAIKLKPRFLQTSLLRFFYPASTTAFLIDVDCGEKRIAVFSRQD